MFTRPFLIYNSSYSFDGTGFWRTDLRFERSPDPECRYRQWSGHSPDIPSGDGFNPRGVTVGPDGNLYMAELGGAIYRFDPTQAEVTTGSNPKIIATVPGTPEALAFAANFDLYVSTSESRGHVYRLHFQPTIPLPPGPGSNPPNPTLGDNPTVQAAFSFGSGAGIAFGENGNLLVAKSTSNGGVSQAVATNNYSSASSLVSDLSNPIGMAVNTCGEILVGVGKNIERHDKKTGDLLGNYVTFGGGRLFDIWDNFNERGICRCHKNSGSMGKSTVWQALLGGRNRYFILHERDGDRAGSFVGRPCRTCRAREQRIHHEDIRWQGTG